MGGLPFRLTTALLALPGLALAVLGGINIEQRRVFQLPCDGVTWADSPRGVTAWVVARDGPGNRAGILEGDILRAINERPALFAADAAREVFRTGVWSQAAYELIRRGEIVRVKVVVAPQESVGAIRHYLETLGLVYLALGAIILVRRRTTQQWAPLHVFCLASFALYAFAYTGKLDALDWTVYWVNVIALLVQPAIFLHFCLSFPDQRDLFLHRGHSSWLLYLPAAFLLALHVLVALRVLVAPLSLQALRWVLDRAELIYLTAYFLAGAAILERGRRRSRETPLQLQLKLLARGTLAAILPFATLYALPYFLGFIPAPWMTSSVFSLIFLPLTLGYALFRSAFAHMRPLSQPAESPL